MRGQAGRQIPVASPPLSSKWQIKFNYFTLRDLSIHRFIRDQLAEPLRHGLDRRDYHAPVVRPEGFRRIEEVEEERAAKRLARRDIEALGDHARHLRSGNAHRKEPGPSPSGQSRPRQSVCLVSKSGLRGELHGTVPPGWLSRLAGTRRPAGCNRRTSPPARGGTAFASISRDTRPESGLPEPSPALQEANRNRSICPKAVRGAHPTAATGQECFFAFARDGWPELRSRVRIVNRGTIPIEHLGT